MLHAYRVAGRAARLDEQCRWPSCRSSRSPKAFSWYAVLTTEAASVTRSRIRSGGVAAALIGCEYAWRSARIDIAALYPLMIAWCVGGAAYVAFMFFVDVPMYWSRWLAERGERAPIP